MDGFTWIIMGKLYPFCPPFLMQIYTTKQKERSYDRSDYGKRKEK